MSNIKNILAVVFFLVSRAEFASADDIQQHKEIKNTKDSAVMIKVGADLSFSGFYASNQEGYRTGNMGHFIDRLYSSNDTLVINPSSGNPSNAAKIIRDHDGGLLGDYSAEHGLSNSSSFSILAENKFSEELIYGGKIGISVSTGKSRAVKASESYIFIKLPTGDLELGAMNGAAERIRVDASSIATIDGGINNGWFFYGNVEGSYINAEYNNDNTTSSTRSRDVRRPFHVLPMLYSEYTHKSGSPWQRHNNSTVGIYPPKISYYSPKFESGFSFGASYTYDEAYLYHNDAPQNEREEYKNVLNFGLMYEEAFDNIKLKLSLTGERGKYQDLLLNNVSNYYDLLGWNIGAIVSYAGFKVAGSFANLYQSGLTKTVILGTNLSNTLSTSGIMVDPGDTIYCTFGAVYEVGPAAISMGYFRSKTAPIDKTQENILNTYSIGSHYNLSGNKHKLTPYIALNYFTTKEAKYKNEKPSYDNNSGYVLLGGVKASF